VEIDPEIVALGEKYFGLKERANTKIIIGDARPFLSKNTEKYDLIEMDLFSGSGEIPFYLATKEFFTLIRTRLSQNGILSINVYDPSEDMIIAKPVINTVASVYKHAYAIHFRYGSHFIMGTDTPLNMEKISEWSEKIPHDERFDIITGVFKYDTEEIAYDSAKPIFTDNLSPLEKLSYEAIFNGR
jgi:spermidine synthase